MENDIHLLLKRNELSRNRTYIRNLEGFCPDPLDDEPFALALVVGVLWASFLFYYQFEKQFNGVRWPPLHITK